MNYNHLHYFYMAVRYGSISAASRILHLSQPSLSSQIKTFEESLGVTLFHRKCNKLELTAAGKRVYSSAEKMFEFSAVISDFVSKTKSRPSPIRLGIADEVERPFAVSIVRNLTDNWKDREPPSVSFTTGQNSSVLDLLRKQSVDVLITNKLEGTEGLNIVAKAVLPVFLVISSELNPTPHRMLECSIKDLQKVMRGLKKRLCLPANHLRLREEIDSFMGQSQQNWPIAFESDTLATVVRAIRDNIGVGYVPLGYLCPFLRKGDVTILGPTKGFWKHTLYILARRENKNVSELNQIKNALQLMVRNINEWRGSVRFSKEIASLLRNQKA